MIRLSLLLLLTIHITTPLVGNDKIPRVPSDMEFAGMRLKITEAARKDIQKDVDALRSSPKYFNIKLDRVKLYFPIIERVLKENNVPEDFKYLSLQESALISDAVSSANAVGFWQFKDFTGREVGLRIDRNIDERLNVVASTVGASKYFKRHNFFFKNWVYTLLAHMTGRGGAKKFVKESNYGAKKMTIDRNTHWYIKRFLAHKIAFEGTYKGKHSEGLKLVEYKKGQGKSLDQVAKDFKVSSDELKRYNKWLKRGKVPSEKDYTIVIPIKSKMPKGLVTKTEDPKRTGKKEPVTKKPSSKVDGDKEEEKEDEKLERRYPSIRQDLNTSRTIFIKINGIPSVLAKASDTPELLAKKGKVRLSKFLKYNNIQETDAVVEGEIYYLKSKKNRANIHYHTALKRENLRDVSQKFGVKLKKLAQYNRMLLIDDLEEGRVLWLREKRPKGVPIEYVRQANTRREDAEPDVKPVKKKVLEPVKEKKKPVVKKKKTVPDSSGLKEDRKQEKISKRKEKSDTPKEAKVKSGKGYHTVAKGETLYSIARKHNVSVEEIAKLNDLQNSGLSIGQRLKVKSKARENTDEKSNPKEIVVTFHVVAPGDTLYGISKKYNISVDRILKINQKSNFDLSIGEKLRVIE